MKNITIYNFILLLILLSCNVWANPCGTDPCNVPCPDCTITNADAIVETGSASFSAVYDAANNGNNTQTLAITIAEPNVPPCAAVDFSYTVNYTIDPFTPDMGISWTNEASFEIQDLAGNVITSQGPSLPGSASNGNPINGSVTGTSASTAGAFTGGVVISVFDNFDDANADGTFSGTLDYTLTIDEVLINTALVPIDQACDDGDPCTAPDMENILPCSTGDIVCVPCAAPAVPVCSGAVANVVQACDDGDPCTLNDMEEIDGCDNTTVCVPCAGTPAAACSGVVANVVQACDDGNPCTINDEEELDGCDNSVCVPCAGTLKEGCTNPQSPNFDPTAVCDNGTCICPAATGTY